MALSSSRNVMQRSAAKSSRTAGIGRQSVVPVRCGLRFQRSSSAKPTPAPQRTLNAAQVVAAQISTVQIDRPQLGVRSAGRLQHVALLVKDLERALGFYEKLLGLGVDPERPHHKLPYRGAWLSAGPEMIHLMELDGHDRPQGGRNRRASVSVPDIKTLLEKLEAAGVPFTATRRNGSQPAAVVQDPDGNTVELLELGALQS